MLAAPIFPADAHAGLHFVKNQKDVILVADAAQRLEPFAAEMIVAAFALHGFDDDGGDIHATFGDDSEYFRLGFLFLCDDVGEALIFRQGVVNKRIADARPGKFGKQLDLARVGVREAHRVAAAAVERAFEMENLRASFASASGQVFAHFPIHGRLEGVFDRQRAAVDEEITLQRRKPHHARERIDKRRVGN